MKTPKPFLNAIHPLCALAVAGLFLAGSSAHAAPTVWNVNIGSDVTTYAGAAPENTASSTWNSFVAADLPAPKALVDFTGAAGPVTMAVTAATLPTIGFADQPGDTIFDSWMKAFNNNVDFTVTFAGLDPAETYDLVVYADWRWDGAAMAITQSAGTGLAAPFVLNTGKTTGGVQNDTGPLSEDTDAANVGSGTLNWNYTRLKTLTPDAGGNLAFLFGAGNWPLSGFQLVKVDLADNTPPSPSPMTWATPPTATSENTVTMTATTATDPNGVEYFFTETTGNPGGTSSIVWQNDPTYIDTGLTPGETYTYTVKARDKSLAQNEAVPSDPASATTNPADNTPPTPDPMTFDIAPAASSITQITMTATTASDLTGVEYYFTETTGNPGGSDSGWQDSPVYTDGGLDPGTSYTYKVKARDKSLAQNPTAESATASASTNTETVVSKVWNVNIGNNLDETDNFVGAASENTANSTWNSVTTATVTAKPLVDSTNSATAGVTLDLSGSIGYGDYADITGPEIFDVWIKSTDNFTPYNMVIGGLSASKTYDLVIYSDWFWKGDGTLPLTQTAGTGLAGTVVLDQISTGTNGTVPGLVEDTDLGPNTSIEGNWIRITGLSPDKNGNLGFSMGGTNAAFNGFQLVHAKGLITSFGIPGYPGVIDQDAKTITLTVPGGTDLATLAPDFTLSAGATCNQTSGSPPSPTFASANPVTYTVTDTSTEPDTVNDYTVTVIVPPPTTTLVIDLGTSPAGTAIEGGTFIGSGPVNLPLPTLPAGSILRSIAVSAKLEATDNDNFASDLSLLLDPTPGIPGGDFSLEITNGVNPLGGAALNLDWPTAADAGVGTELTDSKTDANWAAAAPIDLATTGLFLGNAYGGPSLGGTWSGTITLTYDVASPASKYDTWSGGEAFENDTNGDGVKNGLAFLLGAADPDENALARLPAPTFVAGPAGGLRLVFNLRKPADRGDAKAIVQWSGDLGFTDLWSSNVALVPDATMVVNGVAFQVDSSGALNAIIATVPASEGAAGKLFGRVQGTEE